MGQLQNISHYSGDFTRYTYAPVRREICKNEDAFLHIHTRGLYGKEITVELYERDYLPRDYKLTEKTVVVKDNVVCVVFSMQEAYAAAGAYRSMWAEGGAFELYCKIKVPYQEGGAGVGITHIMTKGEDLLLKIENASIPERISSTIQGIKKFVIGTVEDEDCGGKHCITKDNYKAKGAEKLIQEINIRLAGFGGNVPSLEFTERTGNTIKQFQRDYMQVPETGKICGSLLKAMDEFSAKYPINFEEIKCKCGTCNGFGDKSNKGKYLQIGSYEKHHQYEYPGVHKSLLWALKAVYFYLEKDGRYKFNKVSSGYRCRNHSEYIKKPTTNHMGKALDLHFNLASTNERTRNVTDMETIRKDIFSKYLGAKWDWTEKDIFNLESTRIGATTWVHYDVREFNPSLYLKDEYFAKNNIELIGKTTLDYAKSLGFSDLCRCLALQKNNV